MSKELMKLELSKDFKPAVINQKLNDLMKEVKKITTRKDVVIVVTER
jgi:hypothetical protein